MSMISIENQPMSLTQYKAMHCLCLDVSRGGERPTKTLRDIHDSMRRLGVNKHPNGITPYMAKLEKKGWVVRPDPDVCEWAVTDFGLTAWRAMKALLHVHNSGRR